MDSGVIGRDEELRPRSAFLDGLGTGPRALVIEGEAGIGKTAVWLQRSTRPRRAGAACCAAPARRPRRGCRSSASTT